jgi:hypothetical protein
MNTQEIIELVVIFLTALLAGYNAWKAKQIEAKLAVKP